ncbi:hypothetical protein [Microcoleus sp. FACHB-68]|nr:hypothetical protein [Microcoleus sp. FACHB-68]MBD1939081.1 hypothetical protein [Microcoleus sp. FACHB-68]
MKPTVSARLKINSGFLSPHPEDRVRGAFSAAFSVQPELPAFLMSA